MMVKFEATWGALAAKLGWERGPSERWLADLSTCYAAPDRHYHDVTHVVDLIGRIRRLPFERPDEAIAAAFFHDAIYAVGAPDNEERSAALALAALHELGCEPHVAQRVGQACAATATHEGTGEPDADLFVDVDMAILGDPPERYARYRDAVMREYLPVYGREDYAKGRITLFIDPTLAREPIFLTPVMVDREETARRNLTDERAWLANTSAGTGHGPND